MWAAFLGDLSGPGGSGECQHVSHARLVAVEGCDVEHVAVCAHADRLHLPVAGQRGRVGGAAGAEDLEGSRAVSGERAPHRPGPPPLASAAQAERPEDKSEPEVPPASCTSLPARPGRAPAGGQGLLAPGWGWDLQENLGQVVALGGQLLQAPVWTLCACPVPGAEAVGSRYSTIQPCAQSPRSVSSQSRAWAPGPLHKDPNVLASTAPWAWV